jgi:hypothetical protein
MGPVRSDSPPHPARLRAPAKAIARQIRMVSSLLPRQEPKRGPEAISPRSCIRSPRRPSNLVRSALPNPLRPLTDPSRFGHSPAQRASATLRDRLHLPRWNCPRSSPSETCAPNWRHSPILAAIEPFERPTARTVTLMLKPTVLRPVTSLSHPGPPIPRLAKGPPARLHAPGGSHWRKRLLSSDRTSRALRATTAPLIRNCRIWNLSSPVCIRRMWP